MISSQSRTKEWVMGDAAHSKRAGRKELEKLKLIAQGDQAWYVSRGWFTDEAVQYAAQEGIYISTAQDIQSLRVALGGRK